MKTKKESNSIDEYIQALKKIVDYLSLLLVTLSMMITWLFHVLSVLRLDYKELCDAIRARDALILFEERHDKLLDHESTLKHDDDSMSISSVTAQLAEGV